MNDVDSTDAATVRRRKALPIVIIVLAAILGIVAVLAVWAKRQALETETWTETSTELLDDPAIQDALATFITDQVYANVDVTDEIAGILPPDLSGLAAPISGALRNLISSTAEKALASPQFQALWEDANRAAHAQLLKLLDDKGEFVSTTGGAVTLNLGTIVQGVADQSGIGENLASRIPADAAQLEIIRSDELSAAQSGVKILRTAAWILAALTLGLFALAIFLARGWRREALRAVGIAFFVMGVVVLAARSAGGDAVVDSLAETAAAKPAVESTWEIGTSVLKEGGQTLIAYGIVIVLAAWLAGPMRPAVWLRRTSAPFLREPLYAYGGLAILLIVLFWWDPVEATHRLVPSLLLILVLVVGTEALRRQVIREFPDRVRGEAPPPADGTGTTTHADDETEVMTDEEPAAAKTRVLGQPDG